MVGRSWGPWGGNSRPGAESSGSGPDSEWQIEGHPWVQPPRENKRKQ